MIKSVFKPQKLAMEYSCYQICRSIALDICYEYNQHDKVSDFCYLYNPSNKTKHEIKKKLPFASRFEVTKLWLDSYIQTREYPLVSSRSLLFFFYNPFTDETIKLSALETHLYIESRQVIFSGNPTSRECDICSIERSMLGRLGMHENLHM
ncbi:hypothetical protein Patl1_22778 [Pistacia atlantica]|uniref:Uncharacterized protein n=1 Tax=Pistacia atlantica TaxID=434234 RepID=A0ACC0ZYA5_9ROSI|nr:hypothetical protein Patl1_22778 [Pistacia atlantica]